MVSLVKKQRDSLRVGPIYIQFCHFGDVCLNFPGDHVKHNCYNLFSNRKKMLNTLFFCYMCFTKMCYYEESSSEKVTNNMLDC